MSTMPSGLPPSPVTADMLTPSDSRSAGRNVRFYSLPAPLLVHERADQADDQESIDTVEGAQDRVVLAAPGEEGDLDDDENRHREVPPDARATDASAEREQQEDDRREEDQVPEADVEVEAVLEGFFADHPRRVRPALVVELVRGVEGAEGGRCDLNDER